MMKIIATQGSALFLIDVGDGMGIVLDWESKSTMPKRNIKSILARGYWEAYNGPQDLIKSFSKLLSSV